MFEISANFSEVLGGVLFIVWAVCAARAGRLARRPDPRRLRRAAAWTVTLFVLGGFLLLAQIVLAVMLWTVDWDFAANRVVLAIPVILGPAIAVALLSAPRMWRLSRTRSPGAPDTVPVADRLAATDPMLVVPVKAAALGGFLDFWVVFVDRPAPPYLSYVAALWAIVLACTATLWWRQRRIHLRAADPQYRHDGRRWRRAAGYAGGLVAVLAILVAAVGIGLQTSRLPDHLDATSMSNVDWGGGPVALGHATGMHQHGGRSVVDLTGPRDGVPDARFTLVARPARITLSSGRTVEAWTFNGQVPGPEIRVHDGDLVEVILVNQLPREGVSIHWHGLDVPNAEDGVAGVTQDAVQPGQTHVYRFRPHQVGSFWYHSHEMSEEAVDRGLFGPLVVLPRAASGTPTAVDLPVMAHTWKTGARRAEAFGIADTVQSRTVAAGTPVRLRLTNTSDNTTDDFLPRSLRLTGTAFKVAAIDGVDLNGPTDLDDPRLEMAIGGRYDLTFTMPDRPVRLFDTLNPNAGLVLSPNGNAVAIPRGAGGPVFDPARYGTPAPTPFDASSRFDRRFTLVLDDGPGFYDGRFTFPPTINGNVFPNTPMLMVAEGDLVRTRMVNRGHLDHPMHLHGHHVLVLSRNGRPVSGSPWWTDTLEIKPGEIFETAFRADNPGIWMDHCHNLQHAGNGMVLHLAYAGVTSPYQVGHATVNRPE